MKTNVAVIGSPDAARAVLSKQQQIVVDPSKLMGRSDISAGIDDIEEDDNDRFITTRSGKRRPNYIDTDDTDEWAEDVGARGDDDDERSSNVEPPTLSGLGKKRVKRCGGDDDDDDGDANRSRRSRRARGRRSRRTRNNRRNSNRNRNSNSNNSSNNNNNRRSRTTTTVKRRVIQNGQVTSESTSNQSQAVHTVQAATPVTVQQQQQKQQQPQPVLSQQTILSQTQPATQAQTVVHHQQITPGTQQQVQHLQLNQQPAQVVVPSTATVAQQTVPMTQPISQAMAQPHAAATLQLPAISVQGSVKLN